MLADRLDHRPRQDRAEDRPRREGRVGRPASSDSYRADDRRRRRGPWRSGGLLPTRYGASPRTAARRTWPTWFRALTKITFASEPLSKNRAATFSSQRRPLAQVLGRRARREAKLTREARASGLDFTVQMLNLAQRSLCAARQPRGISSLLFPLLFGAHSNDSFDRRAHPLLPPRSSLDFSFAFPLQAASSGRSPPAPTSPSTSKPAPDGVADADAPAALLP